MTAKFLELSPAPRNRLANDANNKQAKERDGETIIPQEALHSPTQHVPNCQGLTRFDTLLFTSALGEVILATDYAELPADTDP